MSRFSRSNLKAAADMTALYYRHRPAGAIAANARELRDSFGPICAWQAMPF